MSGRASSGMQRTGRLTLVAVATLVASLVQPACARAQQDGDAALREGRYEDAIAAFERNADTDVVVRRKLVRTLMEVGRYADAERAALDGAAAPSLELATVYGEAVLGQGRAVEARRAFDQALAGSARDSARALLQLALLDRREGRQDEALAAFDRFIDIYNGGAAATAEDLTAIGVALSHLGRRDPQLFHDANRALSEATQLEPAFHEARVLRGQLFLDKYNTTDAGALFREVLEQNPHHPGALLGMARVRMIEGSADAAEPIAQALETNPRLAEAYLLRAELLIADERYDSATLSIERALALDSSSLDARALDVANDYLRGEDWNAGAQALLARNPRYSAVYTTTAELAVQTRRYRDAVRMAERAIAVDPTDWSAHALLGLNRLRIGDSEGARASLETAFRGDPFNVWVKNTLDLLDTYDEYVTRESRRFTFFLHGDEADLLFPYASAIAEEAYEAIASRYGHRPETPVRVEVYPRHADFSVRTVGLAGLGALGVSFGSILAMDSPAAREPGSFNWGSTLWHEIAHAVTLGASAHRVPRWLTEGISVREERRARPGWGEDFSIDFALAYLDDRLRPPSALNAGFLRPRFPGEVGLSYYLASLVVEWIEETRGSSVLRDMLAAYGDGRTDRDVLQRVLRITPDRFDAEFDAWLRTRYAAQLGAVELEGERAGGEFLERLAAGRRALEAGDLERAEQELTRAATLFPEYAGGDAPYRLLSTLAERRGDTVAAAEHLARHVANADTDLTALLKLAELRAARGDTAGAAEVLVRAIYVHPFEPEVHEQLAGYYAAVGDRDGVVRARAALVALQPVDRAEALYQLALAQHAAGDDNAARRTVLRALEIAPNYEAAQMLLLEVR